MPTAPLPTSKAPLLFSRSRVRQGYQRALKGFAQHGFLYNRVCKSLNERIQDCYKTFTHPFIMGARPFACAPALQSAQGDQKTDPFSLPQTIKGHGASFPGLHVVLDEEYLPFKPQCFDLIVNPLTLHWVNDIPGVLMHYRHLLKPGGFFLGALLGGRSLYELQYCLLKAESELNSRVHQRVPPRFEASSLGSLFQRVGFLDSVVDVDRVLVTYDDMGALIKDLRGMGETHKSPEVFPLNSKIFTRAHALYQEIFPQARGIEATFEIIYFSGWAPEAAPLLRG